MKKTCFAVKLSQRANISTSKAIEITNAALEILTEATADKDKVQFTGF